MAEIIFLTGSQIGIDSANISPNPTSYETERLRSSIRIDQLVKSALEKARIKTNEEFRIATVPWRYRHNYSKVSLLDSVLSGFAGLPQPRKVAERLPILELI